MAISLSKGQRISLAKEDGSSLTRLCIGVNWGAIQKKGLFRSKSEAVDLDASVGLHDAGGDVTDTVWFQQLKSRCGSVRHSGDDRQGDTAGDDGLDNEVIEIDLTKVPASVTQLSFVLNSFRGQDFANIPFARIRIYEGTPTDVRDVVATFDIANNASFAGKVSMIMGRCYRHDSAWKFQPIGEPTADRDLKTTLNTFRSQYGQGWPLPAGKQALSRLLAMAYIAFRQQDCNDHHQASGAS